MKEPFDIEIGTVTYAVFPEEEDAYTIFKDGVEYAKILKDTDELWLKLDPETETPLFGSDPEINAIGKAIAAYVPEEEDEDEEDEEEEFE